MTAAEQRTAAAKFAVDWQGKGYEKGQSQIFWTSLLVNVLGVSSADIAEFIVFEEQVQLDHTSFIDAYIPSTHVLIEQKSLDKDLDKPIKQSDGSMLTPYQQAQRYSLGLPYSQRPRWIVVSNFAEFRVYDMENPQSKPEVVLLVNLKKEYSRLKFLVTETNERIRREKDISLKAGEIVGKIYDAILKQYKDGDNPSDETLHNLNTLCVRLVFCLYAEDAGIFDEKAFHDYLIRYKTNARGALLDLFKILNTKLEDRNPYIEADLAAFRYANGGLFEETIEIPNLNAEIVDLILHRASEPFNWAEISPTIFGALFESTLSSKARRSGGMHYTSVENIHKVIDPLFLDDLRAEFEEIKAMPVVIRRGANKEKKARKGTKTREGRLLAFQAKLADLTFLDPACGSGNFLTETYLSLRRLENEVIKELEGSQVFMDFENPIKISLEQFYGFEINDFAVSVARTALWIAESQMLKETENIVHSTLEFLPLKSQANIIEGNALDMTWPIRVPKNKLNYIIGNPPFVGARMMNVEQKRDVANIFAGWDNVGNLDYVSCWYKKAADMMTGTTIRAALVSTNSITQGESVANLWKPLFASGVHIDFAHRTFRWESESTGMAHVHCVIVGFSTAPNNKTRVIYSGGRPQLAKNINAYLLDAADIFVESRKTPLCNVPSIGIGNKPIDGGNYLFTLAEYNEFLAKEPAAAKWFRPWYGAVEFIHRQPRYFLYLDTCPPEELYKMPECKKRIEAVRAFRLASKSPGTVKLADTPTKFHVTNLPTGDYIVIPETSSERRRYVPMGYMNDKVLCSNLVRLMPNATLYHFGILESNVHMSWMRAVCGRLKSDYRYSIEVVYNNFPWPIPTDKQRERIEQTAQSILDIRDAYPKATLAELYDPTTMPADLLKAHQANDRAVMAAYGFDTKNIPNEAACVAELMRMYQQLVKRAQN